MSVVVTVRESCTGFVVTCSQCGKVATRELEIDAEAKRRRHEQEHRQLRDQVAA